MCLGCAVQDQAAPSLPKPRRSTQHRISVRAPIPRVHSYTHLVGPRAIALDLDLRGFVLPAIATPSRRTAIAVQYALQWRWSVFN